MEGQGGVVVLGVRVGQHCDVAGLKEHKDQGQVIQTFAESVPPL